MKKVIRSIVGVSFVLLLSACQNFTTSKKPTDVSEEKKIQGPLLAQVNNWRIGLEDFEKELKALEPLAKEQKIDINNYEFKRRVLNELVRNALLAEEAKARGLDKDSDFIEALDDYKQRLLAQKLVEEEIADITVTEAEIEEFYERNKEFFRNPQEIKIREIVVNSESEAKDLYIRLLQGESFSSLATQYSVADSRNKGGDLGYIKYDPSKKFKKFWEIALALDKGEVSSIFKGEDRKFYILKVEDKRGGKIAPLSEVKETIREALKIDKTNKKIEELINSAKQKSEVVINEDLLR
ncbi:MAG: peptidyl-prolyl cis-trans isomerase [Candidatus Omnitrophica bacterium]|nr:peptidyl-prolyl cis-trans isomerase [Candidatus Omnitrophota bacterium]